MTICNYRRLDTYEDIIEEHTDVRSYLKRGLDMASEANCMIMVEVFNDLLRRWQVTGYFHPDGTFTNSFGERQRWTGGSGSYWAPTDLEPYDPFKPKNRRFVSETLTNDGQNEVKQPKKFH